MKRERDNNKWGYKKKLDEEQKKRDRFVLRLFSLSVICQDKLE